MRRSVVCALFGSAFLLSCASPIRLQPLPLDHPANPEALEAPREAPSATLRDGPAVTSSDAGSSGPVHSEQEVGKQTKHSDTQPELLPGKVYTCPKHPKVKGSTPGHCPKCGTALKKKERSA